MHKLKEKADKLLDTAMPLLEKLTDDTDNDVPEKALDAATKIVELAHYLYEVCEMKAEMMNEDADEMSGNPKKKNTKFR